MIAIPFDDHMERARTHTVNKMQNFLNTEASGSQPNHCT